MRTFRSTSLLLMILLGGLLVFAACTPRGGRGGRSGDDDDTTSDDDDSGDDDDAGDDDDTGHRDDDDAGDDDDTGHGDDDDAGDDDDTGHGDDDDSTMGDDDDTGHGDDDDSTGSTTTEPCTVTPNATLVVLAGSPQSTTVDLSSSNTLSAPLSCSDSGGGTAVVAFAVTGTSPVSIAYDHTGGDQQYQVFDMLSSSCDTVLIDFTGPSNTVSGVSCLDPIPDETGTLSFTPATAFGSYALVVSAYESSSGVSTDITISQ